MSDAEQPSELADLLGDPQIVALIQARNRVCDGATMMMANLPPGNGLQHCGTDELPAAVSALEAAEESGALDEIEDGARWVARAVTVTPTELLHTNGADAFAFLGAVMMTRAALYDLDEAKAMNE